MTRRLGCATSKAVVPESLHRAGMAPGRNIRAGGIRRAESSILDRTAAVHDALAGRGVLHQCVRQPAVADLTIVHWIWDSDYTTVAYSGVIHERAAAYLNYQAAGGQVGKCYRSRAGASAPDDGKEVGSQAVCFDGASPPGGPGASCEPTEWFACPPPGDPLHDDPGNGCSFYGGCVTSPIMISLARNGRFDLTSLEDGVRFDLDADGNVDRVSWSTAGSSIGFLVLDVSGNGVIDDGSEMFGDNTRLPSGDAAPNGFVALAQHDANHDGFIDRFDPVWQQLRLWIDTNHNGVSEAAELLTMSSTGVSALDLRHHWTGGRDRYGNLYRYQAKLRRLHGEGVYYDIYLRIER